MSWILGPEERLLCPDDFQAALVEAGGVNIHDEANFKIVWGETETARVAGFDGYMDWPVFNPPKGDSSWLLMEWQAAEIWGTPEAWYVENQDPSGTGLSLAGEYPYGGRYKIIFALNHKWVEDNELKIFRFPLSDMLLDRIVPLVQQAKEISYERHKAYWEAQKEIEGDEMATKIEQIRHNARLAFRGGLVSYSRQGIRTPYVDIKVAQMQQGWSKAAEELMKVGQTSFAQGEQFIRRN